MYPNQNALTIQEALCMSSVNAFGEPINHNVVKFDTDSHKIGIDNRASACISAYIEDFQGPVRKVNRTIKGFGGEHVRDVSMGTIIWKWCDNEGKTHRFTIPNSYYVPAGGVRLLSPQHWAKTQIGAKLQGHKAQVVGETTTATKTVLLWENGKHKFDAQLGVIDNVATFCLASGYKKFHLFCQKAQIEYNESSEHPICIDTTQVISDEVDDAILPRTSYVNQNTIWSRITGLPIRHAAKREEQQSYQRHSPVKTTFNLDGPTISETPAPVAIEEEEERLPTTAEQELLRDHHRLGHTSFANLQKMAKLTIMQNAQSLRAGHAYSRRQREGSGEIKVRRTGQLNGKPTSLETQYRWIN
jgi:hypothetical protein